MTDSQICPTCSVKIIGDKVYFSHGKPGTRERLYARVCRFAQSKTCINHSVNYDNITENDYYKELK